METEETKNETNELLTGTPEEIVNKLKIKSIIIPAWEDLEEEYNPKKHPVMTDSSYTDIAHDDGSVEKLTRITEDLQRLAVKKTTQLCVGIPVERVYKPIDARQKEIAQVIEKIMQSNRIDSVNIERCNMLFASCEVFTLWYTVSKTHSLYGAAKPSAIKVKCKNYSPMNGDTLYPLMDEYGDMLAMSFGSKKKKGDKEVEYLDTFTSDTHIRFVDSGDGWSEELKESITIGKIPGVYAFRPTPIWEDTSPICYEIEWALSRNGNYLRRNSKPIFAVYGNDSVEFGETEDNASVDIMQFGENMKAGYITWQQAVENLKFYIQQLRQSFFSQLQLPDTSFDSMKTTPMSGEARQMMFIDAQLKVKEESGRLLEMFDREINVIKAFVKILMPGYETDIDALIIENVITPFAIRSEKEKIQNLMTANAGKPILSQREAVEYLGWSDDVDKTMQELADEDMASISEPTME